MADMVKEETSQENIKELEINFISNFRLSA